MNIQYFYKKCNPQEKSKFQSLIQSRLKSVGRMIPTSPETILEAKMEKTAKKSAYIVELVLRHVGKRFVAREDDHTIREAVDIAWGDLMSQLRKMKLRHGVKSSVQYKGRGVKDRVRFSDEQQDEEIPVLGKKEFSMLVEKFLKKAKQFVVSEVRFLEKTGDLPTGELETDELVNDVVLGLWNDRARSHLNTDNFLSLFYTEALQLLNKAKAESVDDSRRTSLDSRVSMSDNVDDDEELEFWQPDDIVTLADTLSFPKGKSRHEELRSLVLRELHHLPHRVRQEFNLVYQSGLTLREVSSIVKRTPGAVEKDIHGVLSMLRKKFGGK